jgi:hypothetical protein
MANTEISTAQDLNSEFELQTVHKIQKAELRPRGRVVTPRP